MCFDHDDNRLTASDIGQAMASLGIIIGIVIAAAIFTATLYERPSLEAQQIIQAGRLLVETAGR